MKKSLVLAMAMAMGVTASAYAANPFSDVPAGHWAYDSVSKLAAAGIVQGYGDTTFGGDKLMTRYEMAEIVAKALAKGANVDKLAAEFADELNALGVRVAKLEKKADNVKITGRFRFQGKTFHGTPMGNKHTPSKNRSYSWSRMRSDITLKGAVNEDWTYTAMVRNEQRFDVGQKNVGEEYTKFQRAFVSGRIGGLKVTAGRYADWFADGYIYDDILDGVAASYGTKKLNISGGYATLANQGDYVTPHKDEAGYVAFGAINAKLGKVADVAVGYYNFQDADETAWANRAITSAKLGLKLGKNASLAYTYLKSDEKDTNGGDDAHIIALNYKGANKAKPGTFGLEVIHYDQDAPTYVQYYHTMDGRMPGDESFKGWKVGAGYTFAKNVLLNVAWYDLQNKNTDKRTGTLFGDLNFYF